MWAKWRWSEVYPQYVGPSYAIGAVLGWGRVQRHSTEGWRAETAQVIALALAMPSPRMSTTLTLDLSGVRNHEKALRRIAEQMDVPLVKPTEIEAMALAQGIGYTASQLVSA